MNPVSTYPVEALVDFRAAKDREFKNSPVAPLTPEQQKHFSGLRYYDPNPALVFDLTVEELSRKESVRMMTSRNEVRSYLRAARVTFKVDGQDAPLTLYAIPGHSAYFVPFMDATCSAETYSAGRYLDVERLPNGRIRLDFNLAYSPYCAYNEPPVFAETANREPQTWSCPIPPPENRLTVAIRAGEMTPVGAWVITEHE